MLKNSISPFRPRSAICWLACLLFFGMMGGCQAMEVVSDSPESVATVPVDLWERIRRGFAVPSQSDAQVNIYAAHFVKTEFFEKRADRIRLYLPLIVAELEARRLPLELAMLPLVESALNPAARSPVGATGAWQFMAPTARRFDLRTSRLVDDRKNVRQATRAALDYLSTLYQQFGDWRLAMAAYNCGEGRIQSAVAKQARMGLPADFATLKHLIPRETRQYVPQIMALAQIVASPQDFQVVLPEVDDENPMSEVVIDRDMDLSLALRFSGLSQMIFLKLNPAIKPPLILAAATPSLLLPDQAAMRFIEALNNHQGPLASWSVVRLGQTQPVETLAARHGVSSARVREANGIPQGMKPVAGSVLLIPSPPENGIRTSDAIIATAMLSMQPDLIRVSTTVRPKETLAKVAKRTGVTARKLANWNMIPTRALHRPLQAGRHLTLWVVRAREREFLAKIRPKGRGRT